MVALPAQNEFRTAAGEERLSVTFVTRKWAPAIGGMETWSMKLADRLADRSAARCELDVIALPGRANGAPPGVWALLWFPVTFLLRLMRRPVPDIVQVGDMALWPLGWIAGLRGAKVVLAAHGTDVSYHRRGGLKGGLYGLYLRLGARLLRGALVVANSKATADAARETGWRHFVIVPLATDIAPVGEYWGTKTLLFVGRLVERKGCAWFIRNVLPLLPGDYRLRVVGTKWDADESAALDDPRVLFVGAKHGAELAEEYAGALAVVVPNIEPESGEYEGFGLIATEAAAAGGVALAAKCGGLVEAVRGGETGFHVPAGDARAWAAMIEEVAGWSADQRADFVAGALAASAVHYSWDRVADDMLAAYAGVAAR